METQQPTPSNSPSPKGSVGSVLRSWTMGASSLGLSFSSISFIPRPTTRPYVTSCISIQSCYMLCCPPRLLQQLALLLTHIHIIGAYPY